MTCALNLQGAMAEQRQLGSGAVEEASALLGRAANLLATSRNRSSPNTETTRTTPGSSQASVISEHRRLFSPSRNVSMMAIAYIGLDFKVSLRPPPPDLPEFM